MKILTPGTFKTKPNQVIIHLLIHERNPHLRSHSLGADLKSSLGPVLLPRVLFQMSLPQRILQKQA